MKQQSKTIMTAGIITLALVLIGGSTGMVNPAQARFDFKGDAEKITGQLEMFSTLLDLIGQMHEVAADDEMASVAAVMGAQENFDKPAEAIEFLDKMLKKTESDTVKRAIHMKLGELYRNTGEPKKAVEHVEALITNDLD